MRIAFYAPLKPPDHAVPSGDRAIARLLLAALEAAGHESWLVSRLRSYTRSADIAGLEALRAAAGAEIMAIRNGVGRAPDAWLTYHPYYRSPDLLGPVLSRAWGVPYLTVEASHARKRDLDAWAPWQAAAEEALRLASVHFCFTPRDGEGLSRFLGSAGTVVDLPPFLDLTGRAAPARQPRPGTVELVTIAMMRPDKLASYRFLADALRRAPSVDWRLTIIGDGPERNAVEASFADFPAGRIVWRGLLSPSEIADALTEQDLFVWPGLDEPFGLVYLEAQAAGLPVIAIDSGGVASTVKAGETAVLVAEPTPEPYARAISALIGDPDARRAMGQAARRFVETERTIQHAAVILDAGLSRAMAGRHG